MKGLTGEANVGLRSDGVSVLVIGVSISPPSLLLSTFFLNVDFHYLPRVCLHFHF